MSSPTDCTPCCSSTPITTNIPGSAGANGVNAYTTTTSSFTIPAADGTTQVTIQVADSTWMVAGGFLFIPGLVGGDVGVFKVVSKPNSTSVIVVYPAYSTNTHAGDVILSGAGVAPGGSGVAITFPLPIASGGTASTTKATARLALGVGQDETVQNSEAIAYTITNAAATVTGMTVTVPTTGLYLLLARVTVDYQGVTFAANRTLTIRAQNTSAGTTVVTTNRSTGTPTTQQFVSVDYVLPVITATLTATHVIALQISINTVASAGTSVVNAASLAIIPLNLS